MGIAYRIDGRTVRAEDAQQPVGRISVPEIDFHWCDGVYVRMAGIGGVQTEEAYRGQGVAGRMMQMALQLASGQGNACSGISTNLGNVARRLYARAGYTLLFRPGRFEKAVATRETREVPGIRIRPCEEGDEARLIELFEEVYRPCFGTRRKTVRGWRARREKVLAENVELIQVALERDRVVGWAGCFDQWMGRVTELHVRPREDRAAVAAGLLGRVERALSATGAGEVHLWGPDGDPFVSEFLVRSGYRFRPMRVFYLALIDLPGLLQALRPVLEARLDGRAGWQGRLGVETPGHRAVLELSSSIEVRKDGGADTTLRLSQAALCRMLSGRSSGWELYLDNELSVAPGVTPELAECLRVLFPSLPAFHPADDLW